MESQGEADRASCLEMRAVVESLSPLPVIGDETSARLLFSAGLMGREKILEPLIPLMMSATSSP